MNISDTGKPSIRLAFQQVPIAWQILPFFWLVFFNLCYTLQQSFFWFVTITLSSDSEKKSLVIRLIKLNYSIALI